MPWADGDKLNSSTLNSKVPSWFTGNAFVSVKQFGATGLGAVSDASSIQSALDSLISIGGVVYLPAGTYKLTEPIVLDTRHESIALIGPARGRGAAVISAANLQPTGIGISTATVGAYATSINSVLYGITLQDFSVSGSGDTLVYLNGVYSAELNGLYLNGSQTNGKDNLHLQNVADITVDDLICNAAGRYGVNIAGACTTVRFRGGYIQYNKQAGLSNIGATQASAFIIDGTIFESNGRNGSGVSLAGAAGAGAMLENLTGAQINAYFEGNVHADLVIGGYVSSSGSITRGVECHSVNIDGFFYGPNGSNPPACRDGVVLVNVRGANVKGYYSTHSRAELKIQSDNSADVSDVLFGQIGYGSVPSGFLNDQFNRIDALLPPNGFTTSPLLASSGSAIGPSYAYASDRSLGFYSSASSVQRQSYGWLAADFVSSSTTAQSGATAKLPNQGQLYFSVLSLTSNGGEFGFRSGNTVYRFSSTAVG